MLFFIPFSSCHSCCIDAFLSQAEIFLIPANMPHQLQRQKRISYSDNSKSPVRGRPDVLSLLIRLMAKTVFLMI